MIMHDAFAPNNAGRLAVQSPAFATIVGWLVAVVEALLRIGRSVPIRLLCFDLAGVLPAQPYDDPVGIALMISPDAFKVCFWGCVAAGIVRLAMSLGKHLIQRKGR